MLLPGPKHSTTTAGPRGGSILFQSSTSIPSDDPSFLNDIPPNLSAVYRPLPLVTKFLLSLSTIGLSTVRCWGKTRSFWTLRKLLVILVRVCCLYLASSIVIQESFKSLRPSRITATELAKANALPSPLSRYEGVGDTNVHWLSYENPVNPPLTVYVNHGFGASSLSWLPAIPKLSKALGARRVLGHDAPGFGFTDRPADPASYTFAESAAIGKRIIEQAKKGPIVIFGHSMGAITTLEMACQVESPCRVVLVAPALGVRPQPTANEGGVFDKIRKQCSRWAGVLIRPFTVYTLRRLVGTPGFWRKGLETAWGNSTLVSDSDVLRFQWPSIGHDWETGLLKYASGSLLYNKTDGELLETVLQLPHVKSVDVIVGSLDRVVPPSLVLRLFEKHPHVKVYVMEGLGHDAFEEDTDGFVEIVCSILG